MESNKNGIKQLEETQKAIENGFLAALLSAEKMFKEFQKLDLELKRSQKVEEKLKRGIRKTFTDLAAKNFD